MAKRGDQLTVAEATIQTVSVQIKALMLNNKQMTLSVFRQLPNRPCIDKGTGELLGEPWGLVNYFWDGCNQERGGPHLHVVWQNEQVLCRACVWQTRLTSAEALRLYSDKQACLWDIRRAIKARYILLALDGQPLPPEILEAKRKEEEAIQPLSVNFPIPGQDNFKITIALDSDTSPRFPAQWVKNIQGLGSKENSFGNKTDGERCEDGLRNYIHELMKKSGFPQDSQKEALLELAQKEGMAFRQLRDDNAKADKQHAENYEIIAVLDQLFIAI